MCSELVIDRLLLNFLVQLSADDARETDTELLRRGLRLASCLWAPFLPPLMTAEDGLFDDEWVEVVMPVERLPVLFRIPWMAISSS
jgi:hypothetical protein